MKKQKQFIHYQMVWTGMCEDVVTFESGSELAEFAVALKQEGGRSDYAVVELSRDGDTITAELVTQDEVEEIVSDWQQACEWERQHIQFERNAGVL